MRWTVVVSLAIALASTTPPALAGASESVWKAELSVGNPEAVLGEEVYVKIEITNTGDVPLVMPYPFGWAAPPCFLDIEPLDASYRDQFREELGRVSRLPLPIVVSKRAYAPGETATLGWGGVFEARRVGLYRLRYRCDVPEDSVGPEVNPDTKQLESNDEVWRGSFESNEVTVRVSEPEGVDAEVIKEIGAHPMHSGRYGELLTRFPTSSYAAYVVWNHNMAGTARQGTAAIIETLTRPIAAEWNSVPCDIPSRCRSNGWMSLSGKDYVEWRVRWAETMLQAHPDIWFADEVRLKLALDEYLLGDHASCQISLKGLAEHARPDVAAKAGDILAVTRAKKMLEGTAATPTPPADAAAAH